MYICMLCTHTAHSTYRIQHSIHIVHTTYMCGSHSYEESARDSAKEWASCVNCKSTNEWTKERTNKANKRARIRRAEWTSEWERTSAKQLWLTWFSRTLCVPFRWGIQSSTDTTRIKLIALLEITEQEVKCIIVAPFTVCMKTRQRTIRKRKLIFFCLLQCLSLSNEEFHCKTIRAFIHIYIYIFIYQVFGVHQPLDRLRCFCFLFFEKEITSKKFKPFIFWKKNKSKIKNRRK